jgi:hypothetical protein
MGWSLPTPLFVAITGVVAVLQVLVFLAETGPLLETVLASSGGGYGAKASAIDRRVKAVATASAVNTGGSARKATRTRLATCGLLRSQVRSFTRRRYQHW